MASGGGKIAKCKEKLVLNLQDMNRVKERCLAGDYANESEAPYCQLSQKGTVLIQGGGTPVRRNA